MLVDLIAKLGVFTHRVKVAGDGILAPVVTDSCDGERGAVRACPDHVRPAELPNDVLRRDCQDVCIKVDVLELLVPLDGKDFMTSRLKGFSDAAGSGE